MPGPVVGKLASRWQFSLRILLRKYIALTVIEFVLCCLAVCLYLTACSIRSAQPVQEVSGIKNSSVAYYTVHISIMLSVYL